MHLLEKNILKLGEERVLRLESLNQLFNSLFQIMHVFPIQLDFCFYNTGYILVQTGVKENLD